jgi:hypothetical protein
MQETRGKVSNTLAKIPFSMLAQGSSEMHPLSRLPAFADE